MEKNIITPDPSLVLLIGASGCGKSTFAKKHFRDTEVLSSDRLRAMISDDEDNQVVTRDAFEILHLIAEKRLVHGRLAVVDATNVQPQSRKPLLSLAWRLEVPAIAIVFDLPEETCLRRNARRRDRRVEPGVVHRQYEELQESLDILEKEGFRQVYFLSSDVEVDAAVISRQA